MTLRPMSPKLTTQPEQRGDCEAATHESKSIGQLSPEARRRTTQRSHQLLAPSLLPVGGGSMKSNKTGHLAPQVSSQTHASKQLPALPLTRGRRVHEVKVDQVVDAQRLEQQHHIAQVGTLRAGGGRGAAALVWGGCIIVDTHAHGYWREQQTMLPRLVRCW